MHKTSTGNTVTKKRNENRVGQRRFIVSEKTVTETRNDYRIRNISYNIGALNEQVLDLTEFTSLRNREALDIVKYRMTLRLDLIKEYLGELKI